MNTLEHITHDPTGRLGLALGLMLLGGCTVIVLSKVGKAILFPDRPRSHTSISAGRSLRHVTYPRQPTDYIRHSTGC
jgi:hypothetical protein